jgi:hypothetical protein
MTRGRQGHGSSNVAANDFISRGLRRDERAAEVGCGRVRFRSAGYASRSGSIVGVRPAAQTQAHRGHFGSTAYAVTRRQRRRRTPCQTQSRQGHFGSAAYASHTRRPDLESAPRSKAEWGERLDALAALLGQWERYSYQGYSSEPSTQMKPCRSIMSRGFRSFVSRFTVAAKSSRLR